MTSSSQLPLLSPNIPGWGDLFMAAKGSLIIIGGAEDKERDRLILKEVAKRVGSGKLVVTTLASEIPHEVWDVYDRAFDRLGIRKNIEHLDIANAEDARDPKKLDQLKDASVVFMTGGDQLKITTKIGGSPIADRIFEIYQNGGTIAGTSAGASVMSGTMLTSGESDESHKIGQLAMAPGLGLAKEFIIDQHFAQRGRIGRLLGAVAMNPGVLGIGIDEDTSIIAQNNRFEVVGTNAVYVVDGKDVKHTNVTEAPKESTMGIFGVRLHVLSHSDIFDFETREPQVYVAKESRKDSDESRARH